MSLLSAPKRVGLAMTVTVTGLHLVGGGLLLAAAGHHVDVGGGEAFGIGIGVTAYLRGVRHAFDADHIAAIDNTGLPRGDCPAFG